MFQVPLKTIFQRLLSLVFIVVQAGLLDWHLVSYGGSLWWLCWTVLDLAVVCTFIASFFYADSYFLQNTGNIGERTATALKTEPQTEQTLGDVEKQELNEHEEPRNNEGNNPASFAEGENELEEEPPSYFAPELESQQYAAVREEDRYMKSLRVGGVRKKYKLGALPLAYLSWLLYSVTLAAKMFVLFLAFEEKLDAHMLWGSNMLELAFAGTAAVFAIVVFSHKKISKHQSDQKKVINYMQTRVLLDFLDATELLEFVYEDPEECDPAKHRKINVHVRNSILAFVAIQMVLPTLGLYQLSATNFAHGQPMRFLTMIQQAMNLMFENIPFLVIRIYLWSQNQFTESTFVFIIKNVFEIFMNDWEFVGWMRYRCCRRPHSGKRPKPRKKLDFDENKSTSICEELNITLSNDTALLGGIVRHCGVFADSQKRTLLTGGVGCRSADVSRGNAIPDSILPVKKLISNE